MLARRNFKNIVKKRSSGNTFQVLYARRRSGGVPQDALKLASEQGHYRSEGWRVRKDGSRFWSSAVITPLLDDEGILIGYSHITHDISDRRVLLEQLQQRTADLQVAEKSLRELSRRLLQTQDNERRRLARELHDGMGQLLVAVMMNLQVMQQQVPKLDTGMTLRLEDSVDLLGRAIKEMRTTSYLLHPPMLDEIGLGAALQWLTEGFSERSGIAFTINLPPELQRFSPQMETALFRIVQEALTNIQKHSQSSAASLQLTVDSSEMLLTVKDNGLGMAGAVPENENKGVGVRGMRERVSQLGGKFDLAADEHGATLTVVLPVNGNAAGLEC